jgi:hypothetical protein
MTLSDLQFPVRSDLKPVQVNTFILVILVAGVSIAGMVYPHKIYPDTETSLAFIPTDLLNLVLGIPVILFSTFLTQKQRLIGLLFYPGALFYVTYIYTTYLLGLPPGILFIPYLALVALSILTIFMLFYRMENRQIRERLKGHVPLKSAGYIILIIACLIVIYQVYSIIMSLMQDVQVDRVTIAQWIDDLAVGSPALLATGMWMIKRKDSGYLAGTGALLLLCILFIGLIPVMIVEGSISGTPVNFLDILIISVSSLICLVPFTLFVMGIVRARD